jgi:hypothetical protein
MTGHGHTLRVAWAVTVHGAGRGALRLGGLLATLAVVVAIAGSERFPQLMLLVATVAGIGMGRRSAGDDRVSGRGALLFQQPIAPVALYGARLVTCLALFALAALAIAAAALLAGALPRAWVDCVGAFYWAALLLIMSSALSAFTARYAAELLIVLLVAAATQVLIADAIGIPGAGSVLQWTLVPIDAFFGTWDQLRRGSYSLAPAYAGQLLLHPLAWTAVLLLRVRRADIGAADYQAG